MKIDISKQGVLESILRKKEKEFRADLKKSGLISMKEAVALRSGTRQAIISLAKSKTISMFKFFGTTYVFKKEIETHPIRGN